MPKSKPNFFTILFKEPHLLIGVIALVAVGVLELMQAIGQVEIFKNKLGFIGTALFLLNATLIAVLYENIKYQEVQEEQTKSLKESLSKIEEKILGHRASIVPPGDKYLWDGFTGDYYVFNPSFRIDTEQYKIERLVNVYSERFKLNEFKARYLFLTGDDAGKEAMSFFIERLKDVKNMLPQNYDLKHKIEIKEIKDRSSSTEQEMYLGKWRSEMRAIYELRKSYHDDYQGRPDYYIVFEHQEIIKELVALYFDPAWKTGTKVDFNL